VTAETVVIETADGLALVGELSVPASAWAAAVVCHPHPLYGGDMHNSVVDAVVRALVSTGVATVRFDFRGVGRSEGTHDHGVGERLDAAAALDVVGPFAPSGPVFLGGYSFGGRVALDVVHPHLTAWFALAPPLAGGARPLAADDHRPKFVVMPEHDQFTPLDVARQTVESWKSATLETVPMTDHFFGGRTQTAAALVATFAESHR
jgi:uncharacterized protein